MVDGVEPRHGPTFSVADSTFTSRPVFQRLCAESRPTSMRRTAFTSRCWASTDSSGCLFVAIWITVWRTAGGIRKDRTATIRETQWAADLGGMCRSSLVGYLGGRRVPEPRVLRPALQHHGARARDPALARRTSQYRPGRRRACRRASRTRTHTRAYGLLNVLELCFGGSRLRGGGLVCRS